jgi:hypothetical protein
LHLCAGSARVSSSRLRSLGRSPSLRSFAPLSRGSPPRARFEKPLRGHPRLPIQSRNCTGRSLTSAARSARRASAEVSARADSHLRGVRARRRSRPPNAGARKPGQANPSRERRRHVCTSFPRLSRREGGGGPRRAAANERVKETRDRAERGSAVRGSDQASVRPGEEPPPTYRRCRKARSDASSAKRMRGFCLTHPVVPPKFNGLSQAGAQTP